MAVYEEKKLKEELYNKDLNYQLALEYFVNPVLNSSSKGFVGYTVIFKLYNNANQELLVDYSLKADGTRVFRKNKINL